MIEKLHLQNFKAFEDIELAIRPLTVLIGPNGVGKSSVLKALSLVGRLGQPCQQPGAPFAPLHEVFSGASRVQDLIRQPRQQSMMIALDLDDGGRFSLDLTIEDGNAGDIKSATVELNTPEARTRLVLPSDTGKSHSVFGAQRFQDLLATRLLRLDAEAIALPALVQSVQPRLMDNGRGLAAVLQAMLVKRDGSLDKVEAALKSVVPAFLQVRFQPTELTWTEKEALNLNGTVLDRLVEKTGAAIALELEFKNTGWIPAAQVSEGTLLALALLTVLHGPGRPRLLLLDDIDRGLHPKAQVELVRMLKSILTQDEDLQIICTAHSPMTIAGCAADEVIHLDFDDEGLPIVIRNEGDPPWMTPSEIMADYFGISRLGMADKMQRYGLLASDPRRSDEEDTELTRIGQELKRAGADPGWEPAERAPEAQRREQHG